MGAVYFPGPGWYNAAMNETLKVNEIFRSLQGEGVRAGMPCAFVRLAGCNLRCTWCDTQYAWDEGAEMTLDEITREVEKLDLTRVELTGGEPLIQEASPVLLSRFCDEGFETLLETNGSLDVTGIDERVVRIVDVKCPSSGQAESMHWPNLAALTGKDEVKFVLADRDDFDYACRVLAEHELPRRCLVTLSPVAGRLEPTALAEWILDARLNVRLGLQLHRLLWPDEPRGR
jgi:7-carboxy-7-deazaguanine synthase